MIWKLFKRINWRKEYDILYKYAMKLEKQLNESIKSNEKMIKLLEEKYGNQ